MSQTAIQWTDKVWNPVTGCLKISPGCTHCYAKQMAERLQRMGNPRYQNGFELTLHHDKIEEPLRWRKPCRVFVNSMSDLFHPLVPEYFISRVCAVMVATPHLQYQVLTKRAPGMAGYFDSDANWARILDYAYDLCRDSERLENAFYDVSHLGRIPNLLVGTSVENQDYIGRITDLMEVNRAGGRFISVEPMLGPIALHATRVFPFHEYIRRGDVTYPALDWVICGGESGPGYRAPNPEWVRGLKNQCEEADIPFFFKQWGGRTPKSGGNLLDGQAYLAFPEPRVWEGVGA